MQENVIPGLQLSKEKKKKKGEVGFLKNFLSPWFKLDAVLCVE